jgi:DNA polymerase-3 subunit delta
MVYLFTGPEIGEKAVEVEKRRTALRTKHGSGLEESVFYALENTAGDVCSAMLSGSLFSSARLFIVKNAEVFKKKEDVKLLSSCFETLDETSTVILISDENNIDKTLEKCAGANKKIFWELFESRKKEWVLNFFKREGYKIDGGAVDTILEMVENNTEELKNRCLAITLFCDKNAPLTVDVIEKILSKTKTESAFSLFSALAEGSLERGLEILGALLDAKENAVAIFSGLSWKWHKLRDYEALAASGNLNYFELKKIGLASPKSREDYVHAAKRFDEKAVAACIALTAETDLQIRTEGGGQEIEKIMLELYLVKAAFIGGIICRQ